VGRRVPLLGLAFAAAVSVGAFAAVPHDGFHPLMQMACLLPLQLAALFLVFRAPVP
jgi:hypothetical protein